MNKIADVCSVLDRYIFDVTNNRFIKIGTSLETNPINRLDQKSTNTPTKQNEEPTDKRQESLYDITYPEGGINEVFREQQKRNPKLIKDAKIKKGVTCCICGFNFHIVYGELGQGYIEVHHLVKISSSKQLRNTSLDQVDVVCANCHRMLHRRGEEPLPIKELKRIVAERRKLKVKKRITARKRRIKT